MNHIIILFSPLLFFINFVYAKTNESEKTVLETINIEIAAAEDRGDRQWLENILASELSFRRANGAIVSKEQFLKDVKPRSASKSKIEDIRFYGKDRAIVTCIVTLKIDDKEKAFHNLRLFIREKGQWKLLAWANEPMNNK